MRYPEAIILLSQERPPNQWRQSALSRNKLPSTSEKFHAYVYHMHCSYISYTYLNAVTHDSPVMINLAVEDCKDNNDITNYSFGKWEG